MRGLFKLEGARIWSGVLIIVGVILLIIALVLRWNMTHSLPISDTMLFTTVNTAILFSLGVALIALGITVIILCSNISRMMQTHDEELRRRIENITQ
jgi:uncharacterized membrane protein